MKGHNKKLLRYECLACCVRYIESTACLPRSVDTPFPLSPDWAIYSMNLAKISDILVYAARLVIQEGMEVSSRMYTRINTRCCQCRSITCEQSRWKYYNMVQEIKDVQLIAPQNNRKLIDSHLTKLQKILWKTENSNVVSPIMHSHYTCIKVNCEITWRLFSVTSCTEWFGINESPSKVTPAFGNDYSDFMIYTILQCVNKF